MINPTTWGGPEKQAAGYPRGLNVQLSIVKQKI